MTKTERRRYWAIVPAAGIGSRMAADLPKQYLSLNGKTIIEHTLERLLSVPWLEGVVVALNPTDKYWDTLPVARHSQVHRVDGGQERCESVFNGLHYLQQLPSKLSSPDWVLVHDAARPCITIAQIEYLAHTLQTHDVGGILGVPVSDTIKRINAEGGIEATVDRQVLWQAQTPQMFRFGVLSAALEQGMHNSTAITDEASAVEQLGYCPLMVEGRRDNIKVTRPEDLAMVELILQRQHSD